MAVARPASVDEVARVVACCAAQRVAIVPHGGNTGYCGGATADASGAQLVLSGEALALLAQALPALVLPFPAEHHVLVEMLIGEGEELLEHALLNAQERGLLTDVVVAQSDSQARQLWRLRESIPAAEKMLGGSVKHDVCVPLGDVATYMARARAAVLVRWPQALVGLRAHR